MIDIRVESPFPFYAMPRVWKWLEPFRAKVADDFSPQTLADFVTYMATRWDRLQTWVISGDGELGGLITFEKLTPWLGTAHVLLKPEFHGRGIAVKACREAVSQMFQEVGKLEFQVLSGNLAIGSLLVNIGAQREGTLTAHTISEGQPRDVWAYGLTKANFEGKQQNVVPTSGHPADVH